MKRPDKALTFKLLLLVLRPVVAFCLRHSLRLQDLIEAVKFVFVELGQRELERAGDKANVSRLSAMSGVHRRDVMRLMNNVPGTKYEQDLITRVVGAWRNGERFTTSKQQPRILTAGGDDAEFTELVHSVSADLNPGTVLYELERVGAVQVTARGMKLLVESYVPSGDVEAGFRIYAQDADDLRQTVEDNTLSAAKLPHLHARTSYDMVRADKVEELKRWFLKEGHAFHARVREKVSAYDLDLNPDKNFKGKVAQVTFGSFSNIKPEVKK